jgi:hypothetical protein
MSRFTMTVALAGVLLAGLGAASAQTPAPTGQFGQRTASGGYVPSSHDPGCAGLLCSPLPSTTGPGGVARNPSEVAPPPPCQGLICGLTPYGMQRPYTAAEAAEVERQRAAAQAQIAAAPPPEAAAPVRRVRKHRKVVAKVARTAAPKAAPAAAAARTPAPADEIQSLK